MHLRRILGIDPGSLRTGYGIVDVRGNVVSPVAWGVIRLEGVNKARRYLIPIFLFIAAVITPPDPASMVIVFIPLWLIFELSLLVFRLMLRREEKSAR